MKKKKIVLSIIVIIFIIFLILGIKIWKDMKNAIPSTILVGVDQKRIKEYITLPYKTYDESSNNLQTFVVVKDLLEDLNKENLEVTYYAWILTEVYYEKNGIPEKILSHSKPYKFTLYNEMIEKCKFPKQNNNRLELENIFPQIVIDTFPTEDELKVLNKEMEKQVLTYYNNKQ